MKIQGKAYVAILLSLLMVIGVWSAYSANIIYRPDSVSLSTGSFIKVCNSTGEHFFSATDDNLQTAVEDADGGTVNIPSGLLSCDRQIWINNTYTEIVGQGKDTELRITGNIDSLFYLNEVDFCTISDLLINGDSYSRDADGIYMFMGGGHDIEDVYFHNLNGQAIFVNGTWGATFTDCVAAYTGNETSSEASVTVESNSTRHSTWLRFDNFLWEDETYYRCFESDQYLDYLHFDDCRIFSHVDTPSDLMYIEDVEEVHIADCDFYTTMSNVNLLNITTTVDSSSYISVHDNFFFGASDDTTNGIILDANYSHIHDNTFQRLDTAINVSGRFNSIHDNFFRNMDSGSDVVYIGNRYNKFNDNLYTAMTGNNELRLDGALYCSISDNVFEDNTVSITGTTTDLLIQDNYDYNFLDANNTIRTYWDGNWYYYANDN